MFYTIPNTRPSLTIIFIAGNNRDILRGSVAKSFQGRAETHRVDGWKAGLRLPESGPDPQIILFLWNGLRDIKFLQRNRWLFLCGTAPLNRMESANKMRKRWRLSPTQSS